jgi:hypothetical protein
MGLNKGYLTVSRDAYSDEWLTPRYAVEPIMKYLNQKGYRNIWCPFDKSHSQYVRVLRKNDFDVTCSHKDHDDGDFFTIKPPEFDCIVSNPPFSIKDKVMKKCFDLKKPFALLLPQNSLQSIVRVKMFIDNGGIEYLGFDRRIGFYGNGVLNSFKSGSPFASGYFCKDVLPEKLIFEKIEQVQEGYYEELI